MKRLLFILFFMLSSCVYDNFASSPGAEDYQQTVKHNDLALMKAILEKYAPEAKVYFILDQPLAYGILGITNKLASHTYLVQIHSMNPMIRETLYHEMGHVIDAELGRLDFRGDMKWDGIKCNFKQDWSVRPWEISANEWRDCLRYEYENHELNYSYYFYDYLIK
jgi:hypothetical protein